MSFVGVVTGLVTDVRFAPGGGVGVQVGGEGDYCPLAFDPGHEITFDGRPVAEDVLLCRLSLAGRGVTVTLYPRYDRAGAATRAEFRSAGR